MSTTSPKHEIVAFLIELLSPTRPPTASSLSGETELEALSLDSLSRAAMLTELEDRYQVELGEDEVLRCMTVGDLAELVVGTRTNTNGRGR